MKALRIAKALAQSLQSAPQELRDRALSTIHAFGNFRHGYLIAERSATQILRDPFTNKPFVHFYATKRVGGQVLDSSAIKLLKIEA